MSDRTFRDRYGWTWRVAIVDGRRVWEVVSRG